MAEPEPSRALVGVVGGSTARIGPDGGVRLVGAPWSLDWWIGADDRWHVPARETAVRQSHVGGVPIVETAMRVPGGDARQRVYGAAPGVTVVEVENASPAPFVLALVVRDARDVALDGTRSRVTVRVDGAPALVTTRAPSRWWSAVGAGAAETTFAGVAAGRATDEPFTGADSTRGDVTVAWLHPVAHRTTLRAALLAPDAAADVAPAQLAPADAVERGWSAQLDRGMRAELPDEPLSRAVRLARAELLLAAEGSGRGAGRRSPATADLVAALEDWGFDAEAAAAWERLPARARRAAARRPADPAGWTDVERAYASGDGPALLLALRRALVQEDDATITLGAGLPPTWRGRDLDVHDAPTRRGPVSFAVRWHGARPALLWDVPTGVSLRAPALDPSWTASDPHGEALLAPCEVPA